MSRLPPDVLSFLRRADRMLTDAEASASADEEMPQGMRHEVVDNVVQQLAGSELASACHVFGSSALQRAMRLGSIPQRVALATPMLCAAPTHVLTDKYASHVVETILSLVHESLGAAGGLEWEEGEACLGSLLVGFCDKLLADGVGALRAAMQDRHGTHVLRSLVRTLSGRRAGERSLEAAGDRGGGKGGKGEKGGKGGGGKGGGGKGGGGKGGGGGGEWGEAAAEEARAVPAAFTERLVQIRVRVRVRAS